MNRKYDILSGALLLLAAGGCLQSCQQEDFDSPAPGRDALIEQGRYLTARSADAFSIDYNTDPRPFPVGTPYRLFAFAKPYDNEDPEGQNYDPSTNPLHFRFNKVAWEGEVPGSGLRYINIDSEPDKWFGFSPINGETGGDDGLVSLDFYGFTYGETADHDDSYIPIDELNETAPELAKITRTETVTDNYLNDLMRGELLNQNIHTAGISKWDETGQPVPNPTTQSVIPFKHCFSKLRFQISQQGNEDEKDSNGDPTPQFVNLHVDDITITNTYNTGKVYLDDGKVEVSGDTTSRPLPFDESFAGEDKQNKQVTVKNTDVGQMLIFPSDGSGLRNSNMGDGYKIGLRITVRSTVKEDIENMLRNTESPMTIKEDTQGGKTWYTGTIVKNEIIDYYDVDLETGIAKGNALYFKQNTSYMLIITFQRDGVRIITVIPMVEAWLPGEGSLKDPWQDQAMGQPQMFDNIVWSDRNLGATHYDPTSEYFENSVGYFFQSGRNIPYYPFKYTEYNNNTKPAFNDILSQDLANGNSAYGSTEYRFYPIVDSQILKMNGSHDWCMYNYDQTYTDNAGNEHPYYYRGHPQMMIPDTKPEGDYYFDFLRGTNQNTNTGLKSNPDTEQNMHWEKGQINQPVTGVWIVPSSKDFLTIFPSTPYAGNITFRAGGWLGNPMSWNPGAISEEHEVLRVTVPYIDPEVKNPWKDNPNEMYTKAWQTLKDNEDPGSTRAGYTEIPGYNHNPNYEPDGDPEDGYASVYIISRKGSDKVEPDILKEKDAAGNDWAIKSWGTIYAIKRIYTAQAYRMRWRVRSATQQAKNPCYYVEICRYRCNRDSKLTIENFSDYDWDHPAATIFIPICGLGDWNGTYINFGTECQYATRDPIDTDGKTSAVQIKVTGNDAYNAYISVISGVINRNFGKQIRPMMIGGGW